MAYYFAPRASFLPPIFKHTPAKKGDFTQTDESGPPTLALAAGVVVQFAKKVRIRAGLQACRMSLPDDRLQALRGYFGH
jgi:hypothetical protein